MLRPTLSVWGSRMRILLLGGLAGPILFGTSVVVGASLRPDYDHTMQVMSALGATDSANAFLMNGVGFIPTGILIVGFALALNRRGPRSLLAIVGGLLLGLFGFGIVGAGVYSCDPGCIGVGTTREAFVHIVVSVVAFLAAISALFFWGAAFRSDPLWRPLSSFSFAMGIVAAGLLFLFNRTAASDFFPGLWQRLFVASLFLWCAVVGVYAFRVSSQGRLTG